MIMVIPIPTIGEASGPAALGLDGQAFVIQLVTFLIVFLVLRKWAFKPIIKMLDARRQLIESGVELGEKMRAETAKTEERAAQTLHAARLQADQVLADAAAEAKKKIAGAEAVAQKQAAGIIQQANDQISQAVVRERKRLERELVDLVSDVSQAVIGEKVDAKKDAQLVAQALQERAK